MDRVATLASSHRADLFREVAARTGFHPRLLEKDFWVCWALRHIFGDDRIAPHLRFKGGTSLSKVFGVIQRFSEDIDLAVDWRLLSYDGDPPGADLRRRRPRISGRGGSRTAGTT